MRTLKQTKVKGRGALGDCGNALLTVAHMGGYARSGGCGDLRNLLVRLPAEVLRRAPNEFAVGMELARLVPFRFSPAAISPMKGKQRFARRFAPCKIRAFRLLLSPTPQTQRRRQEQALPPQQWRILIFVLSAFCCRPAERTLTSLCAALIRNGCPAESYSALAINCATRSARRAALSTGSPSIILAC